MPVVVPAVVVDAVAPVLAVGATLVVVVAAEAARAFAELLSQWCCL